VGGTNAANFTVTQPSLTTLIPGGSVDISLIFNTSYITDKTATITIPNDDLTNPNYMLNILGKCNPGSESFVYTGSMGVARTSHTAILLSDGKVLVAGGGSASSAEIYYP
jgi:hypothetical protein